MNQKRWIGHRGPSGASFYGLLGRLVWNSCHKQLILSRCHNDNNNFPDSDSEGLI